MGVPLLSVDGITKSFASRRLFRRPTAQVAVDSVSLEIAAGTALGIVGESGSGKSTVARIVAGLLDCDAGSVRFDGVDLVQLSGSKLRAVRQEMQMVFQDSAGSLNPRLPVGRSIALQAMARGTSEDEATASARQMLERVGLSPTEHSGRFPHQLSGGQRQRVNIARALIVKPRLVILDEPVSALDKTVEAQIVRLLAQLRVDFGLSYLFISHDLSITRALCERVHVMCRGRVVEHGLTSDVLQRPQHPYTAMLVAAQLSEDPRRRRLADFQARQLAAQNGWSP